MRHAIGASLTSSTITYVPGFFKIFDEILVNAADNKINDPTMDTIKVNIDRENNSISVWNNGKGIPVEMHSKEGIMIPELIFGNLCVPLRSTQSADLIASRQVTTTTTRRSLLVVVTVTAPSSPTSIPSSSPSRLRTRAT